MTTGVMMCISLSKCQLPTKRRSRCHQNQMDWMHLTLASSRGYPNLYDTFVEKSHHGDHLWLVLDVAGFSYEHLRLLSPTKSLPRHIVQRGVAGVLEGLGKLHDCELIHGGSYFPFTPLNAKVYARFQHQKTSAKNARINIR